MTDNPSLPILEENDKYKRFSKYIKAMEYPDLEVAISYRHTKVVIPVWNNMILWNYKHYEICHKWNVPFYIEEYTFEDEAEAILEICSHVLDNYAISYLLERYILGELYEIVKYIHHNSIPICHSRYFSNSEFDISNISVPTKCTISSAILGKHYNKLPSTIMEYGSLARSIDHIINVVPGAADAIFTDESYFSGVRLKEYSAKSDNMLKLELLNYARQKNNSQLMDNITKPQKSMTPKRGRPKKIPKIKNMPEYDRDADITRLIFTISAWSNSIARSTKSIDYKTASIQALNNLDSRLLELSTSINKLRKTIKEHTNV